MLKQITEPDFEEMIDGVELSREERAVLLEELGFSLEKPLDIHPALRERTSLRAWEKVRDKQRAIERKMS